MSIILKGMCNFESGGTVDPPTPPKPEDIAPNVVSNVSFTDNGKGSITVKWSDPNDTILEGVTITKWYKTVLVYKKGSAPTSITDGQTVNNYTKNQYLYNGYPLTIDTDVTYYFKFFTVSDKNKTNTSDRSYTFSSKGSNIDPIFGNNSWETIVECTKNGTIPPTWKIGDTKDLTLNGGLYKETVTLQIWDFNHFDKSDGTGKAKLCLGMKNLMQNTRVMNYSNTNNGGWNDSYMKKNTMKAIFDSIPIELRNSIIEVKTEANYGGSAAFPRESVDKVFLPGSTECGSDRYNYDGDQTKFPIFTDDSSRIKKMNNGSGSAEYWWTRSPEKYDEFYFCRFDKGGSAYGGYSNASLSYGVCFCFNL